MTMRRTVKLELAPERTQSLMNEWNNGTWVQGMDDW
jgi:hypothetical protein